MHLKNNPGFSKTGVFVVILVGIILLASIAVGVYFIAKNNQVSSASVFITGFVKDVEKGNTETTFELLDSSITKDKSAAYYSWLFWSSSFSENDISITLPPSKSSFTNSAPVSMVMGDSPIIFTFETSVNKKVTITVINNGTGWKVIDYAVL